MSGRESSIIEIEFVPLLQTMRSLDKLIWWHSGMHKNDGSFQQVKECFNDMVDYMDRYKTVLDKYEKEQFIKNL